MKHVFQESIKRKLKKIADTILFVPWMAKKLQF